jgi:3-hydroxyisobutyrate dehydrogenase-like beta-hydroxyacid dehydrogenase
VSESVGFIGLGIMGSRMAANLRRAGFDLTVFNRTTSTAEAFASEHGAQVATSPAQLAERCRIVVTMLVDGDQVREALLGDQGYAANASAGSLCIDSSTIGPPAAQTIGSELAERAIGFIDAPVTGSAPRAADGSLTIMVGATAAQLERARPLLEAMGKLIVHAGSLGQGQMVKVINNTVAAVNAVAVGDSLLLATASGLELDAVEQVLGSGSGGSTMLALKAGAMRRHDFEPLFKLDHMLKDVRLCLDEVRSSGTSWPAAEHAEEVLSRASRDGLGDNDFAALVAILERDSATSLES